MREPRTLAAIGTTALLVALAALAWSGSRGIGVIAPTASPTPAVVPSSTSEGTVSPAPTVAGAQAVGGLPLGTAQAVATSAGVPWPPPPPATPTATPDPAVWRFEGRVMDEEGYPLEGVCVAIGPAGCQPHSIRTDARGVYYFDVPQVSTVVYELRFEREGFVTIYYMAQPNGPTVFNLVLRRV